EFRFGRFFVLGDIGMIFASEFPERFFDVVGAGVARNAKSRVIILKFNRHDDGEKFGFGAGLFGPAVFEGELGDSGFVEIAKTGGDHAVVLAFGDFGERKIQVVLGGEFECDSAVLGRVGGGKVAGVFAILHILAVGF